MDASNRRRSEGRDTDEEESDGEAARRRKGRSGRRLTLESCGEAEIADLQNPGESESNGSRFQSEETPEQREMDRKRKDQRRVGTREGEELRKAHHQTIDAVKKTAPTT